MDDKELREQEITDLMLEFASDYPQSAIALMIGLLVGFLEHTIESQGGDKAQEIKIDGGNSRHITIHAAGA